MSLYLNAADTFPDPTLTSIEGTFRLLILRKANKSTFNLSMDLFRQATARAEV